MNEQVLSKLKPTLKNYSLHSELDRHSLSLPLARGAWHVFYRRFELVFGLVEIVLWRSLCSALWLEFTCVLGGLILHFGLFWARSSSWRCVMGRLKLCSGCLEPG